MRLIKLSSAGELKAVEDEWRRVPPDAEAIPKGKVALPWDLYQKHRASLKSREALGVDFPNDEDPLLLREDIARLGLIVLEFPTFRDGRAYSQARLLRETLKYEGALRARGDVLRDQIFFMARCGFDSFEAKDDQNIEEWRSALSEMSLWYQPSGGISGRTVFALRHRGGGRGR